MKSGYLQRTALAIIFFTSSAVLMGCNEDKANALSSLISEQGYVDNQDGTITDTKTNLTWMRCSLGQTWTGSTCSGDASIHNNQAAQDIAKQTHFAGESDWRLPTADELHSLVYCSSGKQRKRELDRSGRYHALVGQIELNGACAGNYNKPTIFTAAFPNTPNFYFWTSSPVTGCADCLWLKHFDMGIDTVWKQSFMFHVRLVRGG